MTSPPGKQIFAKHTLPNISQNKVNQVVKFDQLIEYNMRNIFRKKVIHKMLWRNYSQALF